MAVRIPAGVLFVKGVAVVARLLAGVYRAVAVAPRDVLGVGHGSEMRRIDACSVIALMVWNEGLPPRRWTRVGVVMRLA